MEDIGTAEPQKMLELLYFSNKFSYNFKVYCFIGLHALNKKKKNCHDEDIWVKGRYFHHPIGKIFNGEILLYEVFLLCNKTVFQ